MTLPQIKNADWLKSGISRDNNFDLIRLCAALQVVVWHACWHMKAPAPPWVFNFLSYFPGVPIFFFLSGMLVTSSLASSRSVESFYGKRIRRVFPALWLSFTFAIILLISFHQLTAAELKLPAFWLWVVTQLSFLQFYNPEFFRHFGTGVVNGSLWTISVEIGFYLVLPFIVLAAIKIAGQARKSRATLQIIVILGTVLSFFLYSSVPGLGNLAGSGPKAPITIRLLNQTFAPYFWMFGLGILAYLHFEPLKRRLTKVVFILPVIYPLLCIAADRYGLLDVPVVLFVTRIVLCAAVFALGASSRPIASKLLKGWDLSYGLYVFHMLVVNTFISLNFLGSWISMLSMISVSLILAALSWKYVEQPSIKAGQAFLGISWKRRPTRETVAW